MTDSRGAAMRFIRFSLAFVIGITSTAIGARAVEAQLPAVMTCQSAQDYLLKNQGTAQNIVLASRRIVRCGDTAPTTLITALRKVAANSLRDSVVQEAALKLSDRRLVDSVIAFAKDSRVKAERRKIGLALLTRYADSMVTLQPKGATASPKIVLAAMGHPSFVPGNVPMTSADPSRALDAIRSMAQSDGDATVRSLAQLAADQIALRQASRH